MTRPASPPKQFHERVEELALREHDRWVAEKRRHGWIAAPGTDRRDRNPTLLWHESLRPWNELSDQTQDLDRSAIRHLPEHLAAAGYEIVEP